ncbi:hypothetical protein HYQ45_014473 [Verticillium longisporum]|uniref:Uncharacterized protein n=1 Tax=Verticillium longisporum TaxID=100787 RepID=A0A8I3ALQ5_VERLO|nr:hypothetical protein HYQ45_014473 [Verticillium longisporum]
MRVTASRSSSGLSALNTPSDPRPIDGLQTTGVELVRGNSESLHTWSVETQRLGCLCHADEVIVGGGEYPIDRFWDKGFPEMLK